ncbi:MAG: hypothetical protein OEZ13_12815 [Spirochaetia bacterium]|nr:hypothetical protein [Spirochaetia bacterium]
MVKTNKKNILLSAVMLSAVFMFNCANQNSEENLNQETDNVISGVVSKGPVSNSVVTAYKLNTDASRGDLLGSTTTAADGSYSLSTQYDGAVEIVATGGSYSDEATGIQVTLQAGYEMKTYMASVTKQTKAAVTALTTIAAAHAYANAGANLSTAISNANNQVATQFGLSGADITKDQPTDLTVNQGLANGYTYSHAEKYGAVLAAFSQYAETTMVSETQVPLLIQNMAEDFSDGSFDGLKNGSALTNSITLQTQTCAANMNTYMYNFMNSPENNSGLGDTDLGITP